LIVTVQVAWIYMYNMYLKASFHLAYYTYMSDRLMLTFDLPFCIL